MKTRSHQSGFFVPASACTLIRVYRQFTVSLPNTATSHFSFSFSDEHLFPAEFFKFLFLLI
ncbi:hypothetical protein EHB17_21300 [Salmonella enterica subsp. enterica serovar Pomona]|nr:hypothetical protein [Salmonella enterica]EBR9559773.1 hypothetical protein [Salmonella enterica subsp. enterica serovar Pomona]EAU0671344.1 hypothetical protein [Salmonella enterica]EBI8189867.1 hypothetical protein [Salmonella enterica]EBN0951138.1 hypothetical protein [Salmonella enterica]